VQSHDDLAHEYERRFQASAAYRDAVWSVLTQHYFQSLVGPEDVVLDLGAGWGEFIRNIKAGQRLAMDLNPQLPQRVSDGIRTLVQDCSARWTIPDESLDVVFTSNFFEHLPDKDALRRTVLEAFRCLKPNGRIVCMGPNIRFLPGIYWDFWDHFIPLTDRSLGELLELSGFRIQTCIPRFLPYSMSQGFQPPLWMLRTYLKMPWVWRFLGKQFLLIGRKAVN
jgi:SAM-dependent methyltransferase